MEDDAESVRLLYIAFTRARDRLILTGTVKDIEKHPSYSNGADVGGSPHVSDNRDIHQTEQRYGNIGDDRGKRYLKNPAIRFIHTFYFIVEQAGANVAGIGAVIEKGYQGGSALLRQRGYRVESLAIVNEICDGQIYFDENRG